MVSYVMPVENGVTFHETAKVSNKVKGQGIMLMDSYPIKVD